MAWRRPDQGLNFRFTAKRSHEGTGGNVAHFMNAIACGKVVVTAEQYLVELMQISSHLLFMNTFLVCLRNLPTQEGSFF